MSSKKPEKQKISKRKSSFIIVSMGGIVMVAVIIFSLSLSTKSAVAKVCGESANHINYGLCLKEKTLEECKKPKVLPQKNPVFDNVERVIIAVDNYSNNEKSQAMLPDILKHDALEKLLKEKYEWRYKELPEDTEPSNRKNCYNRNGQPVTVYPYETEKQKAQFHKKSEKAGTLAVLVQVNMFKINDELGKPLIKGPFITLRHLRSDVKQDYLKPIGSSIIPLHEPLDRMEKRLNGILGGLIQ